MGRSILISLNTTQAHIQTPSRMNKLLMLAFLVTLMGLMATATPQEDVEELELEDYNEDEADSLEEVAESREVREAGRNRNHAEEEKIAGITGLKQEDLERKGQGMAKKRFRKNLPKRIRNQRTTSQRSQ